MNLTLRTDISDQLEYPVINRHTRLIVTLRLVVTPATNTFGKAVSLDDIPDGLVQRTGEILLPCMLTGNTGLSSLLSEQQQYQHVTPIH